jgi:hypothetical protein
MLEFLAGLVAVILVGIGILIIAGPTVPRRLAALLRLTRRVRSRVRAARIEPGREAAATGLHPGSQRALIAASRLSALLRAHGQEELAAELRVAARRLSVDESRSLYAFSATLRRMRGVRLGDRGSQERLYELASELRFAVSDRAEQLELLPFR